MCILCTNKKTYPEFLHVCGKVSVLPDKLPLVKILIIINNDKITTIPDMPNLEDLRCQECLKLTKIGCYPKLQRLWLLYCPNLTSVPDYKKLNRLEINLHRLLVFKEEVPNPDRIDIYNTSAVIKKALVVYTNRNRQRNNDLLLSLLTVATIDEKSPIHNCFKATHADINVIKHCVGEYVGATVKKNMTPVGKLIQNIFALLSRHDIIPKESAISDYNPLIRDLRKIIKLDQS